MFFSRSVTRMFAYVCHGNFGKTEKKNYHYVLCTIILRSIDTVAINAFLLPITTVLLKVTL